MATIRIADQTRPGASERATASGFSATGGVYSTRNVSLPSLGRHGSRGRRNSVDGRSMRSNHTRGEEDEDPGLRQAGDFKKRQVFTGTTLLYLAYQSIGVIYGDIGTSPLYVFSSTFSSEPSYDDLLGVLSIILWSLTMMVTVKYVLVILHADNEGEGGTFSCYSLLARFANITQRDPREASLIKMERFLTGELQRTNRRVRSGIEKSKFARGLLKTVGVLAVSMVMSDGVLTPAQSILGAVQGLNVVAPTITTPAIVGTTCGILVLLFLIQPLGTTRIAVAFAPIVITWLAFNAGFGIYNLVKFDHSVLKAFNPAYAFEFMARNKTSGWRQLGGVLLAFTGVEALFADLGAFSRRAIQLSWLCYTFPCLLLAYVGQAAYISVHPGAYLNPFFNAVPPGMLYPSLIVAILAAIVASQAIITATFQLLAQIMKLSYFPQIKVVHTSKVFHGQLYVPLLNWTLMVGTVLVAAVYNNTTSLGNAYGVCVMFVTFFDTCMVTLAALIVWRLNPLYVFLPWLTIACMDGLFLSSALTKVPDGAWFTLTLAGVLASLFILWRFGKEQQWKAEAADRFPTSHLVRKREDGRIQLTDRYGGAEVNSIKGLGIFFDKAGETTPIIFSQFLSKLVAAPEVMVFFHLRPLETPSVPPEVRYTVSQLSIPHCYRLIVRHGYMDAVITPDLSALVYKQLSDYIIHKAAKRPEALPANLSEPPRNEAPLEDEKVREEAFVEIEPSEKAELAENEEVADDHREDEESVHVPIKRTITFSSDDKPDVGAAENTEQIASVELAKLAEAYNRQVLYIVGKEQMNVKAGTGISRRVLLNTFLWLRENTRTKIASLRLPTDRIIELGFVKDV